MAGSNIDIVMQIELRACLVRNNKALFHKWFISEAGGNIYGLVEYEDGSLEKVKYTDVIFIDNKINNEYRDYFIAHDFINKKMEKE